MDITPKWLNLMKFFFAVLENPRARLEDKAYVKAELLRLARWVDETNNLSVVDPTPD